jgi:hypothetical protein
VNGDIFMVSIDDDRIKSGELVFFWIEILNISAHRRGQLAPTQFRKKS